MVKPFQLLVWVGMLLNVCAGIALGDEPAPFRPFMQEDYRGPDFQVSTQTFPHGRFKIRVTQARRTALHAESPPYACRAWLEIGEKGENIWQRGFDDIAPANFSYGLFVPAKAPSPRYFAVIKTGDNDGRLFLIDREDGSVHELPGGFFFITADKRYLFSEYAGEQQQFVVFDLIAGKIVLDTKTSETARMPGEIYDWYYDGKKYFFTIVKGDEKRKGVIAEDRGRLYEVNFKRPGIAPVSPDFSRIFHKNWDFDPRDFMNCSSESGKPKDEEAGKGEQN